MLLRGQGKSIWRLGPKLGMMRDNSIIVTLTLGGLLARNLERLVGALESQSIEA